jgi:hypothetical protein
MRSIIDGTRIQDSKFIQGLFWGTVFQTIAAGFALPDDPESTYVFVGTGGATHNIALPRIIGNVVYGGPTGLLAGTHVLDGLWTEIVNGQTVAGNTLTVNNAAGDQAGAAVGAAIAVAASASQYTSAQYQVINGIWVRIL